MVGYLLFSVIKNTLMGDQMLRTVVRTTYALIGDQWKADTAKNTEG